MILSLIQFYVLMTYKQLISQRNIDKKQVDIKSQLILYNTNIDPCQHLSSYVTYKLSIL